MQIIPLTAVPSQSLTVLLNGQTCSINVYQKSTGLYFDLSVQGLTNPLSGNIQLISAMLCLNGVGLVRQAYLGFIGQLAFIDTQGDSDPDYTGLGSRYILTYTP
jgi:hypothetical protein